MDLNTKMAPYTHGCWVILKKLNLLIIIMLLSGFLISTGWADTASLAEPSDLEATVVSSAGIELTWVDNSDNETGFKIERRTSGGIYRQIATVGENTTSYTNTWLSGDTKYYYRVRAYNTAGNSLYSNEVSATTGSIPDLPSDLTATVISNSKIELNWQDNSSNETGFKIERKKSGGSYTQIATVGEDITNIINTGLAGNTKYYYRVSAYNTAGDSEYSNQVSVTTEAVPDAPSDLIATAVSTSEVDLSWTDNSSNETGFIIERKRSGGSYTQISTVDEGATSYSDTGLASNTKYYYRVSAQNTTGDSAYSDETSVTTSRTGTIISLIIGKTSYYVNNQLQTMDTAPIIYADRTLLPIRYVAEAIGADVGWSNNERKVTITLNGTVIELWIGNNYARVNGEYRLIDSSNPQVTPIIVEPGRTMLPLRFIAENLGSKVDWDASQNEVTVTYPAP